jgi:CHAT domain-containing protein
MTSSRTTGNIRRGLARWAALALVVVLRGDTASLSEHLRQDLWDRVVSAGERDFAGRLGHGFPHVPRRPTTRAVEPSDRGRLAQLRARTAGLTRLDDSSPSLIDATVIDAAGVDAAGVADLLAGNTTSALERLTAATGKSNDAETWNDLSAVLLEVCDRDPQRCVDAIAAADQAMARGGSESVARFNRAAAMERLGLLREARAEWLRSAAASTWSGWSAEAEANAARLPVAQPASARVDEMNHALAIHDSDALVRFVRANARLSRAYGESLFTSGWADAWLRNDQETAAQQLGNAREIGRVLAEIYGERMLADAVGAIDDALRSSDVHRLSLLAHGHLTYRDGRAAHRNQEPAKAEALFREAATLFDRGKSPMALAARYCVGSALFVQQRNGETLAALDPLAAARLRDRGYPALDGQIGWERGLALLLRGDYSSAMETFRRSAEIFASLDDRETGAAIADFHADALEFVGDVDEAWRRRREALETFSRVGDADRQITSLADAATAAMQRKEWSRTTALLGIAGAIAERASSAAHAATCHIGRARARTELGEIDGARADLADAERWRRSIKDPGIAARLAADEQVVMAAITAKSDPGGSRQQLTRALDYYRGHELELFAAGALLERARTWRRSGNTVEARADLDDALATIERQRETITDLPQRALMFSAASEIFVEAVDLALDAGDEGDAFALTEQSRGRALLDFLERAELRAARITSVPSPLRDLQAALAPDAAIVQSIVLPHRLATFVVRADGLRVVLTPATPRVLSALAEACGRASESGNGESARADCGKAAGVVLAPIEGALQGVRVAALVVDRHLAPIPFASLPFRNGFLGAEIALVESPSATLAVEYSKRSRDAAPQEALVVAATTFDQERFPRAESLSAIGQETSAIAALYRDAQTLNGAQVTRQRLLRELPRFGAIHFAGHALANSRRPTEARLLIASSEDATDITAGDIAGLRLESRPIVYLSACRGGTPGRRGDGIESLALAFLVAGAPSVVASRWDVEDGEAARIAVAFHRALTRGHGAAEALRDAIRNNHAWLSPAAAGYAAIGGTRELVK